MGEGIKSFALEAVKFEVPRWAVIGSVLVLSWIAAPRDSVIILQIMSGNCTAV